MTHHASRLVRAFAFLAVSVALLPGLASAQQTYFVSGPGFTQVDDPRVHAQYNRTMTGNPNEYRFEASSTIEIQVQLAQPDVAESRHDVSAALVRQDDEEVPLAVLNADDAPWEGGFIDPKTGISYLLGPTLASVVPPGKYAINVWSSNNDASYAIIFGAATQADVQPFESHELPLTEGMEPTSGRTALGWGLIAIGLLCLISFAIVEERRHANRTHHYRDRA